MTPRSTAPSRTWLERLSLGFAGVSLGVSAITLIGWWAFIDELLQPFGVHTPVPINAALGFTALSLALVAIEAHRPRFVLVALIAVAAGGLTLFEHATARELGIDQLFGIDRLLVQNPHPGRMSLLTAGLLLLTGLVLLWRVTNRARRARTLAEAGVGSILTSIGVSTLLAYGADLPDLYRWGAAVPTSPLSAVAFIVLGLALILLAWRESMKGDGQAPFWAPVPVVAVCLSLSLNFWLGLRGREESAFTQVTQSRMEQFALQSRDLIEKQATQLERLARTWGDQPDGPSDSWNSDVEKLLALGATELGCISLSYLDPQYRTVWCFPPSARGQLIGLNHGSAPDRLSVLQHASANGGPAAVAMGLQITGEHGPESGFAVYAPLLRAGKPAGFLVTEFSHRAFFSHLANAKLKLGERYALAVTVGDETVLRAPARYAPTRGTANELSYPVGDRRIRISLTPLPATVASGRGNLSDLALVAGIGITMLLGLSIHLARSARVGQRAAELSNTRLRGENEERQRIEARLKVSDERLRLALDSTQIGIFEWNVTAAHVYYSPGLWAMLGYDHARMPSTVDAWQSLIHPDDLPQYKRRTELQLEGVASFIEPEYRVRARSGDWRWVYTRAKSVAISAEGQPTRIIGTVQDITARREAEFALRESQSEARKLSLVAAKTDNPVLIGAPDGRIEWANEAFCRVMEYGLHEVIGKNPIHFMIGPETDRRSLARIRSAMARGTGISTDVVNYSKSGRKYHLHVEIQPVHNADGHIENFIAVQTDITARVETEDQLRRAKSEADEASRAKSEFLASMSHEIRTPMNGVIGMTSLLMDTTLTGEQRDCVNTIRTSGEALLTIINDILDFSKIESGKMELERTPFDLALCLEEALDLFALQASAKRLEIGYCIASNVPTSIVGDATRLRQVVVNLVNNAVKFTPSGSVSVEVRRAPDPTPVPGADALTADPTSLTLEFTVRDTGIGIPADRIDRLFKAFSQVDSSTTRKYGGTGLGLAISQRLCQLMGGDIRVESSVGHGTTFTFTLHTHLASGTSDSGLSTTPEPLRGGWVLCVEDHPVTQARLRTLVESWGVECQVAATATAGLELAAKRPRPPALVVVDCTDRPGDRPPLEVLARLRAPCLALYPFGQSAPLPPGGSGPFGSTTKPLRNISFVLSVVALFQSQQRGQHGAGAPIERPIGEEIPLEVLLAEDNAVNQKVALRFLERLGYRADAVANGLEAVTTLEHRHYDLVLMDLQMPEMDGFEATRQIRRRLPASRQPKIVALTANAMQADRDLCAAAGMDDHISKPVKMHEISAAIRRHFGKPTESTPPLATVG